MMKTYPIRGVEYTAQEASEKFKVQIKTIWSASARGTLDKIGTKKGPKPYRVKVMDVIYEDMDECCAKTGYSKSHIYSYICRGLAHRIGARRPRPKKKANM